MNATKTKAEMPEEVKHHLDRVELIRTKLINGLLEEKTRLGYEGDITRAVVEHYELTFAWGEDRPRYELSTFIGVDPEKLVERVLGIQKLSPYSQFSRRLVDWQANGVMTVKERLAIDENTARIEKQLETIRKKLAIPTRGVLREFQALVTPNELDLPKNNENLWFRFEGDGHYGIEYKFEIGMIREPLVEPRCVSPSAENFKDFCKSVQTILDRNQKVRDLGIEAGI